MYRNLDIFGFLFDVCESTVNLLTLALKKLTKFVVNP